MIVKTERPLLEQGAHDTSAAGVVNSGEPKKILPPWLRQCQGGRRDEVPRDADGGSGVPQPPDGRACGLSPAELGRAVAIRRLCEAVLRLDVWGHEPLANLAESMSCEYFAPSSDEWFLPPTILNDGAVSPTERGVMPCLSKEQSRELRQTGQFSGEPVGSRRWCSLTARPYGRQPLGWLPGEFAIDEESLVFANEEAAREFCEAYVELFRDAAAAFTEAGFDWMLVHFGYEDARSLLERVAGIARTLQAARDAESVQAAIVVFCDLLCEAEALASDDEVAAWFAAGEGEDDDCAYWRQRDEFWARIKAIEDERLQKALEREAEERASLDGLFDDEFPPASPSGDGPAPTGQPEGAAAALADVTPASSVEAGPAKGGCFDQSVADAVNSTLKALGQVENKEQVATLEMFSRTLRDCIGERRGKLGLGHRVIPVADLKRPQDGGHDELLKHRFLCRGGAVVLVGPSGVGKSSLIMQLSLCWAAGQPFFGIEPARPLRTLIIQAENDEGDMAEMRDGVLHGLAHFLTPAQRDEAVKRVHTIHVTTITGDHVGSMLRDYAAGFDLVVLDPLFAFAGCDLMKARDASHFLREVLAPAIIDLDIGLILTHHSNKPLHGVEKAQWSGSDFAYLGAGSAELTNWPRAVVAIRSIGSDSIFELRAAKRGKRLRWTDKDGEPTTARMIGHSMDGTICWREVDDSERPTAEATRTIDPTWVDYTDDGVALALQKVWKLGEFRKALRTQFHLSENAAAQLLRFVQETEGVLRLRGPNKGDAPLYLIGPEEAAQKEVARLKREAEAAKQGKLGL